MTTTEIPDKPLAATAAIKRTLRRYGLMESVKAIRTSESLVEQGNSDRVWSTYIVANGLEAEVAYAVETIPWVAKVRIEDGAVSTVSHRWSA